jgi:hypothetical protein
MGRSKTGFMEERGENKAGGGLQFMMTLIAGPAPAVEIRVGEALMDWC